MYLLIRWLISGIAIVLASYLLPGVHVDSFSTALLAALLLGVINAFIKPFLIILTLPINIVTLGLFTFVLNALLILLTANIVSGFRIDGFLWALIFSIALSLISSLLHRFIP